VRRVPDEGPDEFAQAVLRLRAARLRPEVALEEVPAPTRIAPYATAFGAQVVAHDDELASGRFVLLYDPGGQDAWEGCYRAVTFVRARLEPELGTDPMLSRIGWSWLEESLDGLQYVAVAGTVTRVVSESFGALSDRPMTVEVEVRASWTPLGEVEEHLAGWGRLLCTVAGLPPLPDGVAPLTRRAR
jgi:hypothetical protein